MSRARTPARAAGAKRPVSPRRPVRPPRRGLAWQWWLMIGLLVAAAVAGIVVQSSRSETERAKGDVVRPARVLGPNGSEIRGSASAPVLVEEWADFQCPACKAFHQRMAATIDQLVSAGRIRFAFHQFPFIGEESTRAAAASTCAGDVGKFTEFHDRVYELQGAENSGYFTNARLVDIGKEVGLAGNDLTTFRRCVEQDTYRGWVLARSEEASKAGISSTPTVKIDGERVPGDAMASPERFTELVDAAARA